MKIRNLILVLLVSLALSSCGGLGATSDVTSSDEPTEVAEESGGGSSGGDTGSLTDSDLNNIRFIASAMVASPMIVGDLADPDQVLEPPASLASKDATVESSEDAEEFLSTAEAFFKMECHMPDDDGNIIEDFCPEGVEKTMDNKFTTCTMVGLAYHAQMYLDNIYAWSYVNSDEDILPLDFEFDNSNTDRLVIDFGDLIDSYRSNSYNDSYSHSLYHGSLDGTYAQIEIRKDDCIEPWGCMSDVFQPYFKLDEEGNPAFMAANFASYNREIGVAEEDVSDKSAYTMRAVILINIKEHKFVVKQRNGHTSSGSDIVAIGRAGLDLDNWTWNDGHYMVRVTDNDEQVTTCVQNGETSNIVSEDACEDLEEFFNDDSWTIEDTYDWLQVDEEAQLELAGFNDYLNNGDPIAPELAPINGMADYPDEIILPEGYVGWSDDDCEMESEDDQSEEEVQE